MTQTGNKPVWKIKARPAPPAPVTCGRSERSISGGWIQLRAFKLSSRIYLTMLGYFSDISVQYDFLIHTKRTSFPSEANRDRTRQNFHEAGSTKTRRGDHLGEILLLFVKAGYRTFPVFVPNRKSLGILM